MTIYGLRYIDTEMNTSKWCVDDAGEPITGSMMVMLEMKADMDATRKYPWSRYEVVRFEKGGD